MELPPERGTAPPALALETVRAGTLGLTEVERPLLPRWPRRDTRRRAGASLRGWRRPGERHQGWPWAAVTGAAPP